MAGVELRGVVDEADDAAAQAAARRGADAAGGGNDPENGGEQIEWDDVFAYSSDKIVQIRDFKLGILYWSLVTVIIMYIIIVVFNIDGRQMVELPGYGTVIARFRGKAISNGKVYDEADLRYPVIEPTGVFVMTKRIVLKGQTRGRCVDMDFPSPCPCKTGDRCVDGFCETAGWCPSLGDANANAPPRAAIVDRFEGLESSMFQIMASISFPWHGNEIYIQGDSPGASNRFKNITLGDIVDLAEPKVNLTSAFEKGALLGISTQWTCDVSYVNCEPQVMIKSLDGAAGFSQKRASHQTFNGVETRTAEYLYGLRLIVDSVGTGKKTSLTLIVIQVGSAIALLRTAKMITDFWMLNMYGEQRKKLYYKCKVKETRDYSDLQDRINLIEDHKQAQVTLIGAPQKASSSGQPRSRLGLGPGGRAGTPSVMLRGRG